MELMPRGNLRQQQANLSLAEALQIVRQICLVLDYAHQQNIFHRAIKPENILLSEPAQGTSFPRPLQADLGLPAWTDMGLNIIQCLEPRIKRTVLPGTLKYVSPEQVNGGVTDAHSDIYSVGVILYELAVGQVPFDVKTIAQARRQHTDIPPSLPRSRRPELPEALEQIILKALAKNPDEGYQSAAALAEDLAQVSVDLSPVFSSKEADISPSPTRDLPPKQMAISPPRVTRVITEVGENQQNIISVDYNVSGFLSLEPGKSVPFSLVVTTSTMSH
jgi:serine/threonine-protein kinase